MATTTAPRKYERIDSTKRTKAQIVNDKQIGDCAECGHSRKIQFRDEDLWYAEEEMLEEYGEPAAVTRYCPACRTSDTTVLLH
jgi:Zn ribbon nucleic-acid-binding protein